MVQISKVEYREAKVGRMQILEEREFMHVLRKYLRFVVTMKTIVMRVTKSVLIRKLVIVWQWYCNLLNSKFNKSMSLFAFSCVRDLWAESLCSRGFVSMWTASLSCMIWVLFTIYLFSLWSWEVVCVWVSVSCINGIRECLQVSTSLSCINYSYHIHPNAS